MTRTDPSTGAPLDAARYDWTFRAVVFQLLKTDPNALRALCGALRDEASRQFDLADSRNGASEGALRFARSTRRDVLDLLAHAEDAERLADQHVEWDRA